jgi:predicted amidohydrolase
MLISFKSLTVASSAALLTAVFGVFETFLSHSKIPANMESVSNLMASALSLTSTTPSPSRRLTLAAAQLGPIHLTTTRSEVLDRMTTLMTQAHSQHVQLIVFPEIAFTTFFPRHLLTNPQELESFFERDIDGDPTKAPGMKPFFDKAREYGMDVSVGYAECDTSVSPEHAHYNSAVYYSAAQDGIISKYRKVHLPGTFEPYADPNSTNQLEKRYFRPGNLGFEAFRAPGLLKDTLTQSSHATPNTPNTLGKGDPILGMLICNDRRWPEAWRSLGLQGVELVLCGYNTTAWAPELVGSHPKLASKEAAKAEALFHHKLTVQHGSYTNSCWSVNVAKCGLEDGVYPLIGGTCVVDPDGVVVAETKTEEDELLVYECDLGMCARGKGKVFAFERHRRTESYGRIVEMTGVKEPEFL